jgi:site-specific DNA-cytosine methylase
MFVRSLIVFPVQVKGVKIGYPCTSISTQNNDPESFLNEDSATGGGFAAMLRYVDYAIDTLEWIITENVRVMFFKRKAFNNEVPIEIQNKALNQRGFVDASSLINTKEYALRHSRTRAWGIYIKMCKTKAAYPNMQTFFLSFRCEPLPVKFFLNGEFALKDAHRLKNYRGDKWKIGLAAAKQKFGKVRVRQQRQQPTTTQQH